MLHSLPQSSHHNKGDPQGKLAEKGVANELAYGRHHHEARGLAYPSLREREVDGDHRYGKDDGIGQPHLLLTPEGAGSLIHS
jgi:hypothetical protein